MPVSITSAECSPRTRPMLGTSGTRRSQITNTPSATDRSVETSTTGAGEIDSPDNGGGGHKLFVHALILFVYRTTASHKMDRRRFSRATQRSRLLDPLPVC